MQWENAQDFKSLEVLVRPHCFSLCDLGKVTVLVRFICKTRNQCLTISLLGV